MKLRALPGLALLTLLAAARAGHAEGLGPNLVRLLNRPSAAHPFADAAGRIPVTVKLPPGADAEKLGLFEVAPGIGATRLDPADVGIFAEAHPELTLEVGPRLKPLLNKSAGLNRLAPFVAAATAQGLSTGTGRGVAVGVVDTGIDIMHPDFRDAQGKTRIAWLLYELGAGQTSAGLHPDLESQFGCNNTALPACTIYAAADIDALIAKGGGGVGDSDGHGTHVASIAAGNGGVMSGATPTYIGMASEATLIIAAAGGGAGYSTPEVLRGTSFIIDRAGSLNMPVVTNFSVGTNFGPHDGTTSLETGLASFVGDSQPGHVMVASVGNSGGYYNLAEPNWYGGIHTDVHVSPDEIVNVPLLSPAASASSSQIAIWIAWKPGSNVSVALEGPDHSTWIGFVGANENGTYGGTDPNANAATIVNNQTNPDLDITADNNSAVVVIQGNWQDNTQLTLQLRGQGDADLWIDATGLADPGPLFLEADDNGSVTIPATSPSILSAGCTINRATWTAYDGNAVDMASLLGDPLIVTDNACAFSARGPTRTGLAKPEIGAPGGFVVGAMSSAADPRNPQGQGGLFDQCPIPGYCMVVDNHHAVAQGTSMSSPQVAGAAALLLEIDPTLTQSGVTATLQAGARLPAYALVDPDQLGVGALDIAAALDALVGATGGEPSAAHSWFTLSNNYVQPNPTYAVAGMIELRDQNDSTATVDEAKLRVTFDGGLVVQEPTRVSASTFQFAVAAPPSSVGATLVLNVTYAGVPLGAGPRNMPVGQDIFRAITPLSDGVSGGTCSLGTSTSERRGNAPLAVISGLLLAASLRRRPKPPT